jgi:hypothetical protein
MYTNVCARACVRACMCVAPSWCSTRATGKGAFGAARIRRLSHRRQRWTSTAPCWRKLYCDILCLRPTFCKFKLKILQEASSEIRVAPSKGSGLRDQEIYIKSRSPVSIGENNQAFLGPELKFKRHSENPQPALRLRATSTQSNYKLPVKENCRLAPARAVQAEKPWGSMRVPSGVMVYLCELAHTGWRAVCARALDFLPPQVILPCRYYSSPRVGEARAL